MSLPEFSTRYPVTIAMATFAVVLLGWISLDGLGTDLLPNVETPVITVDLQVPGKSPQEMEERYTRRLERDISTVSGVDRVYSITRSGQAVVVAEFTWERPTWILRFLMCRSAWVPTPPTTRLEPST